MNRRSFLYTTFLATTSSSIANIQLYMPEFDVIDSVLEHMFNHTDIIHNYKDANVIEFIKQSIFHPAYDKEIREFVIQGAKELLSLYPNFISLSYFQKEIYLRSFEDISMGQSWLYRVQILALEAFYSAPVYGVNLYQRYYKPIEAKAGEPLPIARYIEL